MRRGFRRLLAVLGRPDLYRDVVRAEALKNQGDARSPRLSRVHASDGDPPQAFSAMASDFIRSATFGIAPLLALTFIPAGTLDYWQGWMYVATWILVGSPYTAYVSRHDPALLRAIATWMKSPTERN